MNPGVAFDAFMGEIRTSLNKKRGQIYVVNKHAYLHARAQELYIGGGTALGVPIHLAADGNPFLVIEKYRDWLIRQLEDNNTEVISTINAIAEHVRSGKDIALVCRCAPEPCHGDIIKELIQTQLDILEN